ncbi:MAG: PAS domain-containing protein, partial [Chlorobia bacterium]|nr:PAS domain-containing protein [Fimbriimonadaceae bacterium]
GLSTDTVRTYWQRIRQKVGAGTRGEIIATISDKNTAAALKTVETEKDALLQEMLRRKSVENALRASEKQWHQLADAMPQMVFVSNSKAKPVYFNARFLEYTGLSQEEALKGAWKRTIHFEDIRRVSRELKRFASGDVPAELEVRIRRFDGEYRWHMNRAASIRNEHGRITQWYGTSTDIHESKLLRDRLLDSTTFLSQAQRIARLGSYEYDVKRNLGRWSENLFEIFGIESQDGWFDSDEFMTRIHPQDVPHVGQAIRETIDRGAAFNELYRYIRPDGQVIRVHSVANPVSENGKVVRLIGTVQDITEQSETEQRLRDSERLLEEAEEVAGIGSYYWDLSEDRSHWSKSMYRIFERKPEKGVMNADEFYEILHPDDHERYTDSIRKTIETGQPLDTHYRLVFGNRLKHIQARGSTTFENGKVVRLVGTCQDVTKQRIS